MTHLHSFASDEVGAVSLEKLAQRAVVRGDAGGVGLNVAFGQHLIGRLLHQKAHVGTIGETFVARRARQDAAVDDGVEQTLASRRAERLQKSSQSGCRRESSAATYGSRRA